MLLPDGHGSELTTQSMSELQLQTSLPMIKQKELQSSLANLISVVCPPLGFSEGSK